MPLEYFSLPMNLETVMQKKELPKCSLQQSVYNHLHLLITTAFGEFPADESFGSGIWDNDFDNITSSHKIKEVIRQSLLQSIKSHEQRIGNVRVELVIFQEELGENQNIQKRVKKRIDVSIAGTLNLTNERFNFRDNFFVGPLS